MRNRFIGPLELVSAIVPETDESEMTGDYVRGYIDLYLTTLGKEFQQGDAPGNVVDNSRIEPSLSWSSGCIIASMEDLARWIHAVGSGELLNDEYQNMLENDHISIFNADFGMGWGLGFMQVTSLDYLGHTGQLTGYDTGLTYNKTRHYAIAVGVNRQLYGYGFGDYKNMNTVFIYGMTNYLNGNDNDPSDFDQIVTPRSKNFLTDPLPYMW